MRHKAVYILIRLSHFNLDNVLVQCDLISML